MPVGRRVLGLSSISSSNIHHPIFQAVFSWYYLPTCLFLVRLGPSFLVVFDCRLQLKIHARFRLLRVTVLLPPQATVAQVPPHDDDPVCAGEGLGGCVLALLGVEYYGVGKRWVLVCGGVDAELVSARGRAVGGRGEGREGETRVREQRLLRTVLK